MAIYYTDFLSGDDTTGDGSFATPFKTIYRGTQAISANGDEVRVVGSGWTDLPGTLSFTYNSGQVNTSQDLTALFPELSATVGAGKVLITVDDEFGFFKTVFAVHAVTSTTLTISNLWPGATQTIAGKRLTTQHYYATEPPVSPLGVASTFESLDVTNISTYENLKITGGWTADGVQGGITAFVQAALSGATTSSYQVLAQSFTPAASNLENLYISGFALTNMARFNSLGSSRHAIGDFWFVRCTGLFNAGGTNIVSRTGEIANLHAWDSKVNDTWQVVTLYNVLHTNLWHSHINISNGDHGPWQGDPDVNWDSAKMFGQIHFRRTYNDGFMGYGNTSYFELSSTFRRGPLYIDEIHVYANNPTRDNVQFPISNGGGVNISQIVKKVYATGPVGFTLATSATAGFSILGDGTQTLNDLRLCSTTATNIDILSTLRSFEVKASDGDFRAFGPVATGGQTFNAVLVVREETVEKVTGTNSLAVYGSRKYPGMAATSSPTAPLAFIPAFKSIQTLTIKMKSSGINLSQWNNFRIDITNGQDNINLWTSAITGLSTDWQDFVYTIDTTALNFPSDVSMFQLNIVQSNIPDQQTGEILYIDSISIV